jgi:hypothetical protein
MKTTGLVELLPVKKSRRSSKKAEFDYYQRQGLAVEEYEEEGLVARKRAAARDHRNPGNKLGC